jgi:hypothetical protein
MAAVRRCSPSLVVPMATLFGIMWILFGDRSQTSPGPLSNWITFCLMVSGIVLVGGLGLDGMDGEFLFPLLFNIRYS